MLDAEKRQGQTSLFFDFTAKISSNGVLGSTIETRQKGIPEFVESGAVGTLGSRSEDPQDSKELQSESQHDTQAASVTNRTETVLKIT